MQLIVFAVGRMKNGPERELTGRYLGRLEKAGPSVGLTFSGVTEIAESRAGDADRRKADEGAHCLSLAEDRSTALVAFHEGGKMLSSEDFANWIARQRDDGRKRALFAIGGPDGHARAVLGKADLAISLGRMTWPHQIARILVAEQLYRAASILAGHPYHRH
ncbi:MAG: 23S rRNA (pseudouridine(1915)-N(3))-methyltransferase RlmH [Roseitalea sp.]|jgi:23S rRNA (pseudouridine1915-N3)-methyltransferase|nr:23S rRNA (pseudouridine(1915)-N(3))-methyltransferase RlmH [Roseitalea sp.]MBO6721544.1 23S rRNA (pseudouridine(1915)-N(3))-methyltransferase RlmH [Roseitalea sp.]MBO6743300.1 23S rRNA (pseudouridine(1915)-N(3))-methyltransferase RlmH [Roseitalea sp.]